MAVGAGKVALVTGTTTLGCNGGSIVCNASQLARIIDLVGYGAANFFEGTAAGALSNTTAARRTANNLDTDNNAVDFEVVAPDPRSGVVEPPRSAYACPDLRAAGRRGAGEAAAPAPPAEAAETPPAVAALAPAGSTGRQRSSDATYRVQLAAVRVQDDARRAWEDLVDRLGTLVADYKPFYERAETANGVFTRIQLGPFASEQSAERLCVEVQRQNASCFVVAP
jgi:cell division septation protein DedD